MTDKRLCRLFAGLVAVLLLVTAATPLTAFGDDLPPPAASSADVTPEPPAPPPSEASSEAPVATSTETSTPSSTPEPSSPSSEAPATSESSSESVPPPASESSSASEPSSDSSSSSESVAPPDSSSSTSSTPDSDLPVGSSDLPIGSSDLPVGSSDLPLGASDLSMMMASKPNNNCSIGATVSFANTTVNPANGDPVVTLKLERISNGNVKQTWFVTKRFEGGALAQEFEFHGLPRGNYRLAQLPTLRYEQLAYRKGGLDGEKDVNCAYFLCFLDPHCSSSGTVASFELDYDYANGHAFIRNKQKTAEWFTDTDLAVNRIVIPRSSGGGCNDGDDDDDDDRY